VRLTEGRKLKTAIGDEEADEAREVIVPTRTGTSPTNSS